MTVENWKYVANSDEVAGLLAAARVCDDHSNGLRGASSELFRGLGEHFRQIAHDAVALSEDVPKLNATITVANVADDDPAVTAFWLRWLDRVERQAEFLESCDSSDLKTMATLYRQDADALRAELAGMVE